MSMSLFITEHVLGKSKVGKLLMNGYNCRVVPPDFYENTCDSCRNNVLTIKSRFKESKQCSQSEINKRATRENQQTRPKLPNSTQSSTNTAQH